MTRRPLQFRHSFATPSKSRGGTGATDDYLHKHIGGTDGGTVAELSQWRNWSGRRGPPLAPVAELAGLSVPPSVPPQFRHHVSPGPIQFRQFRQLTRDALAELAENTNTRARERGTS